MELSYWQSRWKKNKTGFHMAEGYKPLQDYFKKTGLKKGSHVLVPLCGKSQDMIWLAQQGMKVTGVEISDKAVSEFFLENNLNFTEIIKKQFKVCQHADIELWQGNFFKLTTADLETVDLIYDKASLVALPQSMRKNYVDKINSLGNHQTQMLIQQFIYPQDEMNGPPFSVSQDEFEDYFADDFEIEMIYENQLSPVDFPKFVSRGLKSPIIDRFYLLNPRKTPEN